MSEQSNNSNAPYNGGIHGLSWFVAVLAFVVVCLGGATKSKEAGLTIADPVTFAWMPAWLTTENINAEYTHRIVAFLLACSTLLLMGLILAKENRSAVRKLAVWAFLAVVAQAVLGALTVKFLAKAHTSIPHAVLGQSFFCIAVCLICVTSRAWVSAARQTPEEHGPSMRKLGVWLMIAIVVQLLLGAALRHDNKAEALRNGNESVFIWHLVAHILGAFAVLFFAARVMSRVFRQHRGIKMLLTPTHVMMGLLTLQLALGIGAAVLKVMTGSTYDEANAPPFSRVLVATSHQATGALILACSAVITVFSYRLLAPARKAAESEVEPSGALGASA